MEVLAMLKRGLTIYFIKHLATSTDPDSKNILRI